MTAPSTSKEYPKNVDPSKPCKAYQIRAPHVRVCRDVFAGTARMRERGPEYLPKHPAEKQQNYNIRLATALLFNALRRTVNGLVGMMFRREPMLADDLPEQVKEHWLNVDLAGTGGPEFAKSWARGGLIAGYEAVLVDYPVVDSTLSVAEVKRRGLRPFWVRYAAEDVLSVSPTYVDGRIVIAAAVLRDNLTEPDYPFGEKHFTQIRVLRRVAREAAAGPTVVLELWRQTEKGRWYMHQTSAYKGMDEIPLVILAAEPGADPYGGEEPPLLDLAWANVAHYQVMSDRRHALHIADVPVPVFIGRDTSAPSIKFGPNVGIDLPQGADFKWVETQGRSFAASREELQDLEQRMAALGLAMLQRQTRAAETAEAKAIDKSESDSALASYARAVQAALTRCLELHAKWLGLELPTNPVSLNMDFLDQVLSPAEVDAYSKLHVNRQISIDTLWSMLQAGEVLPADFDPKVERVRLENEDVGTLPATGEWNPPKPDTTPPPPIQDDQGQETGRSDGDEQT